MFRFHTPADIQCIHDLLQLPPFLILPNCMHVSSIEAFCTMLHRLSTSIHLPELSHFYGCVPSVLSQIYNQMIEMVYLQLELLFHWDHWRLTVEKLREYSDAIFENGGDWVQFAHGIFRFINGTFQEITHPLTNQEMFYSGWKHCHRIKFQGIMAPDGMIVHVAGPFTAKHHDMWMLC